MNISQYIAVLGAFVRHDLCHATGAMMRTFFFISGESPSTRLACAKASGEALLVVRVGEFADGPERFRQVP